MRLFFAIVAIVLAVLVFVPVAAYSDTAIVSLRNCDLNNNNRLDPVDVILAVINAPPPENQKYRISGKLVWENSLDDPPYGTGTRHGYVDSFNFLTDKEQLLVKKGQAVWAEVSVPEITILWYRKLPGELTQDVFLTFTYSDQEFLSEEEIRAIFLAPTPLNGKDPNQDGVFDATDVAIISFLLPLPKGTSNELDEKIVGYFPDNQFSVDGTLIPLNVQLAAKIEPKPRLATTWAKVKI